MVICVLLKYIKKHVLNDGLQAWGGAISVFRASFDQTVSAL